MRDVCGENLQATHHNESENPSDQSESHHSNGLLPSIMVSFFSMCRVTGTRRVSSHQEREQWSSRRVNNDAKNS